MSKLALINPAMSLPKNKEDEFRVKVGLRNNRLIALREAKGLTQTEAAKLMKMSVGRLNGFECLRDTPITNEGVFSPMAQRIADFYETKVSWIFPEAIEQIVNRELEFTRSAEEMPDIFREQGSLLEQSTPAQLLDRKVVVENLHHILQSLTPRQEKILKMRFFEEKTYKEIGKIFGITGSRVRDIEAKALRLLRHPSRANRIKDNAEDVPLMKAREGQ